MPTVTVQGSVTLQEVATGDPDLAAWADRGWRGYRRLSRANGHAERKP